MAVQSNLSTRPNVAELGNRGIFRSTTLTRVLVVLGALVGSIWAGWSPSPIILIVPVAIIATVLLIKRPQIGFVMLVIGSLVVPGGISTGTESRIHAGMIILIGLLALWILDGVINRTLTIKAHPTTAPLIVFLIIAVLAFMTGQLDWFLKVDRASIFSQLGGLGLFFLSAAAFWLAAFRIRQVNWLQSVMWVFLALGALWVFSQLVPSLGGQIASLYERNSSGATGSVFWVWLMALAFGQALLNKSLPIWIRVALIVLVALSLYITLVITRDWTSGWLPAVVALGMIIWQAFPRYRYIMLVVMGVLMFSKVASNLESFVLTKDNDYSLLTRVAAWGTLWELIRINPILGFGPANYYFYTPLFNILGYTNLNFNSHNNYVDMVAQTGFLGLSAFLWFAWRAGKYTLSLTPRLPEGFARAYAISVFAGWVGTLVSGMLGDWFLPFVYNVGFAGFRASIFGWIFLGGVITLDRLLLKPSENDLTESSEKISLHK
jgi:O-antigen ligase